MARDFTEAVSRWRELRTLCSRMEQLIDDHGHAYTDAEGNSIRPEPKTKTDIEEQIDELTPKIKTAYNAMEAAVTP